MQTSYWFGLNNTGKSSAYLRNITCFCISMIIAFMLFACAGKKFDSKKIDKSEYPDLDENVILPPNWAFGVLYGGYTDQEQTIQRINKIMEHDYPIDAYWIDSWFWSFSNKGFGPDKYIDFVADTIAFPNRKAMWDFMQFNNIKGGFWIWDAIQQTGNEEAFADFEQRGYFRDTYINTNSWHNKGTSTAMHQDGGAKKGTLTGNIDFDNPSAAAYFKNRIRHFFYEGADFVKLDRTTRLATVKTMFELSQQYGLESSGRGFMLSHKEGVDDLAYKRYPAKWTSDTRTDWTIEHPQVKFDSWVPAVAFKENIALFTDPDKPSSQIPFLTNDTGGFDKGSATELSEELFIRWVQFSTFTPIVEIFSQPENRTANLAFNYSLRADSIYRALTHFRLQLFPYIYTHALNARLKSRQLMNRVDSAVYDYTFGDAFLVAPVYEEGAKHRIVNFPKGKWLDFFTLKYYEGDREHVVKTSLISFPLFVKAGSIIPLRKYSSSVGSGNNDFLALHVYLGDSGEFILLEDDGVSNGYLNLEFMRTVFKLKQRNNESNLEIMKRDGYYPGSNNQRTFQLIIHTTHKLTSVRLDNKILEGEQKNNTWTSKPFSAPTTENLQVSINH